MSASTQIAIRDGVGVDAAPRILFLAPNIFRQMSAISGGKSHANGNTIVCDKLCWLCKPGGN